MSLIRILVDGYSLLHAWPELVGPYAPYSEDARDRLVSTLRHYQDSEGTPITIFFDGAGRRGAGKGVGSNSEVEVLFSKAGVTADAMIERAALRFCRYGQVMVVTDDNAEREMVHGSGALTVSCLGFISQVEAAMDGLKDAVRIHNDREGKRFRRGLRK